MKDIVKCCKIRIRSGSSEMSIILLPSTSMQYKYMNPFIIKNEANG